MFLGCAPFWMSACAGRLLCKVLKKFGKLAIHCLYCIGGSCCCCCPCSLPRRQPVRGRLLVRIRHYAEVQLRILEGYNLLGVDTSLLGSKSSDPYCVVEYKGKKVAKKGGKKKANSKAKKVMKKAKKVKKPKVAGKKWQVFKGTRVRGDVEDW